MSPSAPTGELELSGFPRLSGDEPMRELMHSIGEMFSPRERG